MPKADQPHTTAPAASPSRHAAKLSPHYAEYAAKLAEATAGAAAFMNKVRAAATYLTKRHGYSLTNFAKCTGLHKNSLMRLKDPTWVTKPATLQKLDKLIVRAEAKRNGEIFKGETIKRGRPGKAVKRNR